MGASRKIRRSFFSTAGKGPGAGIAGFTLLEAIVALVLIAGGGVALLGWLNGSLLHMGQIQAAQERSGIIRNALGFMENINPMLTPKERRNVQNYTFAWNAVLREPVKQGISRSGKPGFYQLGLYDTEVEVYRQDTLLVRFRLRQLGYRQIGFPQQL